MLTHMKEDINSVFGRDPAARTKWEVAFCYPGLHAVWVYRISHRLWRGNFRLMARMLSQWARWLTGIEIHPAASIGRRFFIDHGMGVVIGETAVVGNDVTLYQGVTLGGTTLEKGKRHPTIEDGVVVGAGAQILGPFTVGNGARIGSNAVVTKSVPANATMVGIPARAVAQRSAPSKVNNDCQSHFHSYGTSHEDPDLIAQAFEHLVEHVVAIESHISHVHKALRDAGFEVCASAMPILKKETFSCFENDEALAIKKTE